MVPAFILLADIFGHPYYLFPLSQHSCLSPEQASIHDPFIHPSTHPSLCWVLET